MNSCCLINAVQQKPTLFSSEMRQSRFIKQQKMEIFSKVKAPLISTDLVLSSYEDGRTFRNSLNQNQSKNSDFIIVFTPRVLLPGQTLAPTLPTMKPTNGTSVEHWCVLC